MPILAYHSISENLFGRSHPYNQINTSVSVFASQMKWLRQAGYRSINLSEMVNALEIGRDLSRTVVLTFDDGYQDFYRDAYPLLKQCGFTATVFLASDRIRDKSVRIEGADYLTWSEVRELHSRRDHVRFSFSNPRGPPFPGSGTDRLRTWLFQGRRSNKRIGAPVESFSYPFALPEEDRDFTRYLADTWKTWAMQTVFHQQSVGPSRKIHDSFCHVFP